MKFVLAVHGWELGGFATFCQNLAVGLRGLGHEVVLLILPEFGVQREVPAGVFDACVMLPRGIGRLRSHVQKVARAIDRLAPDILVLNDVPYGMAALPFIHPGIMRMPVLHSVAPDEVELGLNQAPWWDRAVAVSEFVERAARAKDSGARVSVCPSGVPLPGSWEGRLNRNGECPLEIISVGRVVVYQKRMDRIPAVARLLEDQRIPYRWTVLGDGEYLPRLRQQLKEFGMEGRFRLPGAVDQLEVRHALQRAEVFVMPSDCEGMPQALLEAMAQAVVPVVSRIPGATTWVEEQACGYACEPSDIVEFASAIADLARNRRRCAELGSRAARHVAQHFSLEAFTRRFLMLVGEVRAQATKRPVPSPASPWLPSQPAFRCLGFWRSLRHQSFGRLKRWLLQPPEERATQPYWRPRAT